VGRVKLVGPASSLVNRAGLTSRLPANSRPSTLTGAVLAGPCCLGTAHGSCGCAASGNPASGSLKQQRSDFLPGEASGALGFQTFNVTDPTFLRKRKGLSRNNLKCVRPGGADDLCSTFFPLFVEGYRQDTGCRCQRPFPKAERKHKVPVPQQS
jgi:hypothetical protein